MWVCAPLVLLELKAFQMLSWAIMLYTEDGEQIWLLSKKNCEVWTFLVAVKYVTTHYELLFCLKECCHWRHYLAFHRLCSPTCQQCMPSTMGHRGWRKLERVYTTVPWFWQKVSDFREKNLLGKIDAALWIYVIRTLYLFVMTNWLSDRRKG